MSIPLEPHAAVANCIKTSLHAEATADDKPGKSKRNTANLARKLLYLARGKVAWSRSTQCTTIARRVRQAWPSATQDSSGAQTRSIRRTLEA